MAHHSVFHFYTHTYVFVRKIHSGRTDPNVKLNAKQAGSVWRGSQQPFAMTLTGRASVGCSIKLFSVVETLRVRERQCRFCLISGVGVFNSRLQSMVFTTPNRKLGLNMTHFLEIIFNERNLST